MTRDLPAPTEAAVLDALRSLQDPEQGRDIVTLGLVRDLEIRGADVTLTLAFTNQPPATKVALHSGASRALGGLPGVGRVQIRMGGAPPPRAHAHGPEARGAGPAARPADLIPE